MHPKTVSKKKKLFQTTDRLVFPHNDSDVGFSAICLNSHVYCTTKPLDDRVFGRPIVLFVTQWISYQFQKQEV